MALPGTTAQVGAAPAPAGRSTESTDHSDNRLQPWQKRYQELNQQAVQQRLRTGGKGDSERLAKGVHGRVATSGPDRIFALLVEFGDTRHSAYCDSVEEEAPETCAFPSDGTPQRYDGPLHNQIPKPNRRVDNTTPWEKDFNRSFYRDMYFNRMLDYYDRQSGGRYSFTGSVTPWVKVPFNEARYGRDFCGDIVCTNTWFLVRDALAQWVDDRVNKSGWSMERVQDYLATFDVEDRYDFDGDGDFREPDGYIDHLQIVHAGGDQADSDPIFGSDAIWSHRWYAELTTFGEDGPQDGLQGGGVEVGEGGVSDPSGSNVTIPENRTGIWAGDYTIQPENGGLGVFAHEYAHDLGLPDLYDASGNTGGAENSTAFWTMMSSGSNVGRLNDPDIGDHPTSFGAWEKFQLGWLDYSVVRSGRTVEKKLRPLARKSGRHDNGVIVMLPEKRAFLELGAPCTGCGDQFYWSNMGNEISNTMTRSVDGGGALTAQVRYDIEEGFDYAFLEASSDGGETWAKVDTSESYDGDDASGTDPEGFGITGDQEEWTQLTATVPAETDTIRWRYTTDPAVSPTGFQVDQITLDGEVIGTAENAEEGWVFDGFEMVTGSVDRGLFLNAYFVENRQYVGDDRSLRSAYNLGFIGDRDFWVEKYAYQPGALINYWDSSYVDNSVGDHPGHGEVLPVDANPRFDHMSDGALARPRVSSYDSTFRLRPAPGFTLHNESEPYRVRKSPAVSTFDDRKDWWFNTDEHAFTGEHEGRYQPGWYGVDVPKTGTRIKVLKVSKKGIMTVRVKAGRG